MQVAFLTHYAGATKANTAKLSWWGSSRVFMGLQSEEEVAKIPISQLHGRSICELPI
jgi:hypothetical protein